MSSTSQRRLDHFDHSISESLRQTVVLSFHVCFLIWTCSFLKITLSRFLFTTVLHSSRHRPTNRILLCSSSFSLSESSHWLILGRNSECSCNSWTDLSPNMPADRFGVYNAGIPCLLSCGILIFTMTCVKAVAGMIVVAMLYGFMSGACMFQSHVLFTWLSMNDSPHIDCPCTCRPVQRCEWPFRMTLAHIQYDQKRFSL